MRVLYGPAELSLTASSRGGYEIVFPPDLYLNYSRSDIARPNTRRALDLRDKPAELRGRVAVV